jgi:hypothetical protein
MLYSRLLGVGCSWWFISYSHMHSETFLMLLLLGVMLIVSSAVSTCPHGQLYSSSSHTCQHASGSTTEYLVPRFRLFTLFLRKHSSFLYLLVMLCSYTWLISEIMLVSKLLLNIYLDTLVMVVSANFVCLAS